MKGFRFKSLTMRIWAILTGVILLVVASISLLLSFIFDDLHENREREILHISHQFAAASISEPNRNDVRHEHEKIHHALVEMNENGVSIISKTKNESLIHWMSGFIEDGGAADYHQEFKETYDRQSYLFEISAISANSFLISYLPLRRSESLLEIVSTGIIVILFGLLIAKLIANNLAKPLQRLEEYTKRIANKDWGGEIKINSSDEIGRLAAAMNKMQHALRQADEEEKKFLQSISHDLKTPVMVIMSYAQAIIDGLYIESLENTALTIKKEAERLEKKIKQILYLNSLDYLLDNEQEKEEVYFDKLLPYLVRNFQLVNGNLEWELKLAAKDAIVIGDPEKIRISLENILENQLRYARHRVEVSLHEEEEYWVIQIANDGPLIPDKDREQIFHRFYKGDNGNFGLGLAISKKIIDYYLGQIHVENQENRVVFSLFYPKHHC